MLNLFYKQLLLDKRLYDLQRDYIEITSCPISVVWLNH